MIPFDQHDERELARCWKKLRRKETAPKVTPPHATWPETVAKMISQHGELTITDLARKTGAKEATIRGALSHLVRDQRVRREVTHGVPVFSVAVNQ